MRVSRKIKKTPRMRLVALEIQMSDAQMQQMVATANDSGASLVDVMQNFADALLGKEPEPEEGKKS